MALLLETSNLIESFEEDTDTGEKKLYIQGVFLMANKVNRNGRIYPKEDLEKAVNRYKKEYLDAAKDIYDAAGDMLELLNDLMDIDRGKSEDFIINLAKVDVPNLIARSIRINNRLVFSRRNG